MSTPRVLLAPLLSLFLSLAASNAMAANIVGQYALKGTNPGSQATYAGTAMIEQKGEVYIVGWKIGKQELVGTGILTDKSFAVVYTSRNAKEAPGLVLYQILPDGSMVGKFTGLGGTSLGTETWNPVPK